MGKFEDIEELAEQVVLGKIGLVEAMLSLPEDLSGECGEVIKLDVKENDNGN